VTYTHSLREVSVFFPILNVFILRINVSKILHPLVYDYI